MFATPNFYTHESLNMKLTKWNSKELGMLTLTVKHNYIIIL